MKSAETVAPETGAQIPPRPDVNCEKVIGHRHRFIFVGVPKSATRSFLTLFVRQPPIDFDAEQSVQPLPGLVMDPALKDYFRFSFVRNPWARVVSAWLNKVAHPRQKEIEGVINRCPGLRPGMPFEEFVHWLVESPHGRDEGANRHWQSQHRFLFLPDGSPGVHWLGRLEQLEEGFRDVCRQLDLPPDLALPRKNATLGSMGSGEVREPGYREHYTPTTREIVARRYGTDIELFKYTF